jgi:hypothetical protein
MKYALLIYPKPGSEEALGEDEQKSVSAEYLAFATIRAVWAAPTCRRSRPRRRSATAAVGT